MKSSTSNQDLRQSGCFILKALYDTVDPLKSFYSSFVINQEVLFFRDWFGMADFSYWISLICGAAVDCYGFIQLIK